MRRRCNNPNYHKYKYYGGIGIRVCEEWNSTPDGFENFYLWVISNGYEENLTIDRIDSSKDYCPENCRWITLKENRLAAIKKKRVPKNQYFAYNKDLKQIVIFYKVKDFEEYSGIDERRISDCLSLKRNIVQYNGWQFKKIPIKEANIIKGQETIPFGSTTDDELLSEVQIVRLKFENYEYVLKFLHIIG